jgi:predicted branched-subunit amino acid permease
MRKFALGRGLALALWPVALAIFVFGAIYGTLARPIMGIGTTLISSALIFSGALQFTVAGLLMEGAGAATLIAGAVTLNVRHLLLGAVLRTRIKASVSRRARLAWWLLDETVGLALTQPGDASSTLWRAGIVCYVAWVGGSAVGAAGGSVEALQSAAEAVFPVLFIGLAALSSTNRSTAIRAVVAAGVTAAIALMWEDGRPIAPVIAALVVALPGGDSLVVRVRKTSAHDQRSRGKGDE